MKTSVRAKIVIVAGFITMLSAASPSRAASFLQLSDIEGVSIVHEVTSCLYGRCFRFLNGESEEPYWGHIFDRENRFYDKGGGWGPLRIQAYLYPQCLESLRGRRCGASQPLSASLPGCGYDTQTGDNLFITYDGGQKKHIFLPALIAFTELYVGSDGSTYYDTFLTQTAQEALPPSPSPTPTCMGWHTPSPTPTTTPTPRGFTTPSPPPGCYCCPSSYPVSISLSNQTLSGTVTYDSTYSCLPDPAILLSWWTSCTDWLEVTPSQGFGLDGQLYSIRIALGDTSSLPPGWHRSEIVYFHDACGQGYANVSVAYYKATPPPTPSPTDYPTPSPTPDGCSSPSPTITPDQIDFYYRDQVHYSYLTLYTPDTYYSIGYSSSAWQALSGMPDFTLYNAQWSYGTLPDQTWWSGWFVHTTSTQYLEACWPPVSPSPTIPPPTPSASPSPCCLATPVYMVLSSGDYNGDGTSDFAVFRPSIGLWAVRDITRTYFGTSGDLPVSGDYDGNGTADIAYFRPSECLWSVLDVGALLFGEPGDVPVPGDYDGDGACDAATFRKSSGVWSVYFKTQIYFGASNDCPVPGDYDGDDTTDIAVFRPSSGMWSVMNVTRFYLGSNTDRPVAGDFSGTGQWEGGIFRPSSGMWAIRNVTRECLGICTDWPLPPDYDGDGADDLAIFRDATGMWSVLNLTRVYFGSSGDVPVTR